jgi:hypothetical protein
MKEQISKTYKNQTSLIEKRQAKSQNSEYTRMVAQVVKAVEEYRKKDRSHSRLDILIEHILVFYQNLNFRSLYVVDDLKLEFFITNARKRILGNDEFEFILLDLVEPILYFREENLEAYENIVRVAFFKTRNRLANSHIFGYELVGGEVMRLHAADSRTLSGVVNEFRNLQRYIYEEISKLKAQGLAVKLVTAKSHLILSHPKIFQSSGFVISKQDPSYAEINLTSDEFNYLNP